MLDRKIAIGALIAAGALLLIPGVAGAVARAARPVVRAAMKAGASGYEDLRRAGAEVYEHMEDLAAEVRAEMAPAAAGAPQPGDGTAAPPAAGDAVANDGRPL